jgi:hypothetical protein
LCQANRSLSFFNLTLIAKPLTPWIQLLSDQFLSHLLHSDQDLHWDIKCRVQNSIISKNAAATDLAAADDVNNDVDATDNDVDEEKEQEKRS